MTRYLVLYNSCWQICEKDVLETWHDMIFKTDLSKIFRDDDLTGNNDAIVFKLPEPLKVEVITEEIMVKQFVKKNRIVEPGEPI